VHLADDKRRKLSLDNAKLIKSFGAEVAKRRHNVHSAEVDYSRPPGASAVDCTVCRQVAYISVTYLIYY